jgi:DNA-directed RNA polymerase subunit RPC12/RpoP
MPPALLPTSVTMPFTCAVCHRHVLIEITDLKVEQRTAPAEWTCTRCSTKHLLPLIGRVVGIIEASPRSDRDVGSAWRETTLGAAVTPPKPS